MNSATIYLPLSTWVNVRCFTNAGFLQQVIIIEENGANHTVTGNGEHDAPMPNGNFSIQTPATSKKPLGYAVTVTANSSQDGGRTWQPSSVSQGSCSVMYYSLAMVVSEDYIDNDWNDSVAQFTWWVPPTGRSAPRKQLS
jgi:hypothetical protein